MTDFFNPPRNSHMDFDKVYFWTDTVLNWIPIFHNKDHVHILISSLRELVQRELIAVYSFVIMPNHLHLVWEIKEMNGKENPIASFNKFTSHLISKNLKNNYPKLFSRFQVEEADRRIRIWQRDPLAVLMDSITRLSKKLITSIWTHYKAIGICVSGLRNILGLLPNSMKMELTDLGFWQITGKGFSVQLEYWPIRNIL